MKKILILAAFVAANLWAYAQMTPEAIMNSVPKMPTNQQMLDYYRVATDPNGNGVPDNNVISKYQDEWKAAKKRIDENTKLGTAGSMKERVGSSKVGSGIDKTVDEVEAMSEAEQEAMAMAAVQQQLAGMGISPQDFAKLQSGNMSEAEMAALSNRIIEAQTSGKNQQKSTANQRRGQMLMEAQEIDIQMKAVTDEILSKKSEARKAGKKLFRQKYEQRYNQLEEKALAEIKGPCGWEKFTDEDKPKVEASCARLEAVRKQQHELMCQFYSEFIPMWRSAVTGAMEQCKSDLLPLAQRREKITKDLYEMNLEADFATYEIYTYTAACTYFDLSEAVVDFELNFDEEED